MLTYKDFIGQNDIKYWDGVSRTFTRTTSTGGTVTLNKVGTVVDALQVYGSGDTYTDATLNNAISQIGSNNASIVITPGTWTVSNNVTFPNNVTVIFPQGATLSMGSGKTVTFNGDIIAGISQIFSGSGTAAINKNPAIYPEWWGALGDGTTDDNSAIAAAIAAGTGKVILFTKTTYLTTTLTLDETDDNLIIAGAGMGVTIKLKASATDNIFNINEGQASPSLYTQNIIFRDIILDGNRANQTDTDAGLIHLFQCKHIEFQNVGFKEVYGNDAVVLDTCEDMRFTGANTIFDQVRVSSLDITDCENITIDNGVVFSNHLTDTYAITHTYSGDATVVPRIALKIDNITINGIYKFLQITHGAVATKELISLTNINATELQGILVDITGAHSVHMENIAMYDAGTSGNYWLFIADGSTITDKVYCKNITAKYSDGAPIQYFDPDGQVSFAPEILTKGHQESTATSGTGEDDLKSVTITAYSGKTGASPMTGHIYKIRAAGVMSGNNDNKTVKLYWGTEVIATLNELNGGFVTAAAKGYDNGDWLIEADVYLAEDDTFRFAVKGYRSGNLILADVNSAVTFDMTSDFTCKITGECDNASDTITQWLFDVTRT